MSQNIRIEKSTSLKPKQPEDQLVFGTAFTDHMFVMDYEEGKGWYDPRIVPYAPFSIEPAMVTLHYAQAVFEGMKAFRQKDGAIAMFRPMENVKRLNYSGARVCIPPVDEAFTLDAIRQLVEIEKDWVPHKEGCALYIRPFIFATESFLGVRPARKYRLMVILSPVGAYYSSGFAPVKILVTDQYTRSARKGTGDAKAAGNYAGSLLAAEKAKAEGYTQVLWLDGAEQKFVEEVGTMNIMFKLGDEVVTPPLSGSILGGITRKSVLQLLNSWDIKAGERMITIDEVLRACNDGSLEEIFGTGTAAVISAVGELKFKDTCWKIPEWKPGPLAQRLFDEITGIQYGRTEDRFGWMDKVTD